MASIDSNGKISSPDLDTLNDTSSATLMAGAYVVTQMIALGVIGGNLFASTNGWGEREFSAGGFIGGAVLGLITALPLLAILSVVKKILKSMHEQFHITRLAQEWDAARPQPAPSAPTSGAPSPAPGATEPKSADAGEPSPRDTTQPDLPAGPLPPGHDGQIR